MTSSLQVVTDQFPLLKGRVLWRFEHDELFKELCHTYETCLEAIARLEKAGKGQEPLRREYSALRLQLETELLGYLQDTEEPGPQ